jgi:hypothetical protein
MVPARQNAADSTNRTARHLNDAGAVLRKSYKSTMPPSVVRRFVANLSTRSHV